MFQKEVTLKDANTKILYKFVVDGNWTTDHEGAQEDDGSNNVNNVLHPEDIKKAPTTLSSAAPESTTAALAGQVPKEQHAPGAFPETPANETEQTFGVAPIPASSGVGNPDPSSVTANTVDSTATTSKEAYDNAGTSEFPGASKEAHEFGVNPIPASSGIGNPVSTKPGEAIPEQVTTNTVDSTVTTSKEDYEKASGFSYPAAGAAVGSVLAGAAAAIGFGSKEENKKNLIPESSLPMGEAAGSGQDAGPHIQSAGPGSTTAALAAGVPLEKDKVAGSHIQSADPESTTAGLAAGVPLESEKVAAGVPEPVKESFAEAHQSAEAAASPDAVKDKQALEKELLSKTSPVEGAGESAKQAVAGQTSYYGLATDVPKTVEESMQKAHASPEAAADSSVVAEKSALERELESKVPRTDATGEPAPVVTAETSATAPAATGATGGAVAAGAATAAGVAGVAGVAAADKTTPGASKNAAAAISDGADDSEVVTAPKTTTTTEKTEGDATEYAPPAKSGAAPGVSDGAAAAVADGADSGLADEPAVKMMNQNEAGGVASTDGAKDEAPAATTSTAATPAAAATTATDKTEKPKTETKAAAPATSATKPTSATSTPTKKPADTPTSSPANTDKKKKHRISSFFKKIFD